MSTNPLGMMALTVRQPWASLIISGQKNVENRCWSTQYRGRLAIHAAKTIDEDGYEIVENQLGLTIPRSLPRGLVLGTVTLHSVVADASSPWALPGCWHWCLSDPRPFRTPFHARGQIGLWKIAEQDASSF